MCGSARGHRSVVSGRNACDAHADRDGGSNGFGVEHLRRHQMGAEGFQLLSVLLQRCTADLLGGGHQFVDVAIEVAAQAVAGEMGSLVFDA